MIESCRRCVQLLPAVFAVGLSWCGTFPAARADESPQPLVHAHAHNDYEHERPLLDALAHGFCSIEADIHLQGGEILVGHDPEDLRPDRTLEALYLKPLSMRVKQNGGRVYAGGPTVTLLVDIKTEGAATYRALRPLLAKYSDMLTHFALGIVSERAVTVVISGNRPKELIASESERLVGIDGRVGDLRSDADFPSDLVPLISDNWMLQFTWRGEGEMPEKERAHLARVVRTAHDQGRRVRFWATPENEAVWRVLLEADVDLIGTDDLPRLARFLQSRTGR
jgi:glycerophosphoryl diester phosphodiesterase